MELKKKLLRQSRLYLIADKETLGRRSFEKIRKLTHPPVSIVQLRDKKNKDTFLLLKEAFSLRKLLRKKGIIFIVNDSVELAKILDADGVHLGQADLPLPIARRILGKEKLIGVSCHNIKQALCAQRQGADYIGIGPVFATSTKPHLAPIGLKPVRECRKRINIPFFAIGGINPDNINTITSSGTNRVAVCGAVFKSPKPLSAARKLYASLLK